MGLHDAMEELISNSFSRNVQTTMRTTSWILVMIHDSPTVCGTSPYVNTRRRFSSHLPIGVVTIYEQVKAHFDNFENNNGRKNAKSSRALIEGTNELPTQKTQPESQQGASLAYHAPFSPNQNYQFFTNADGGIQMDNQGNASLDCGMKDGKSSNNVDLQNGNVTALFPFDGLNVEDVWNWMLVTDSIEPTDETEWMGTQVVQNGSEPLRES